MTHKLGEMRNTTHKVEEKHGAQMRVNRKHDAQMLTKYFLVTVLILCNNSKVNGVTSDVQVALDTKLRAYS